MQFKIVDKNYLETQFKNFSEKISSVFAKKTEVPTKTSQIENDNNFISDGNYVHTDENYTSTEKRKLSNIEDNAQENLIENITLNGTEQPIVNKNVSITEIDPTVPSWAKQPKKPTYTPSEIGALPNSTTLADLNDDSTHRLVTDAEKTNWNSKYTKPNDGIPSEDLAVGVIPTTLPASDVKQWAKADEKPTYTADEVGALPNTTIIPTVTNVYSPTSNDAMSGVAVQQAVESAKSPIATTSIAGLVKPDGKTITIDTNGTIHSAGGGGASSASAVSYDNGVSGLDAINVQNAIDEIVMSQIYDRFSLYNKTTVFNEDGSITETANNNLFSRVTVFNEDGSIMETIVTPKYSFKKITTFNEDGSITESFENI